MPFIFWPCIIGLVAVVGLFAGMELGRPYPSDRKKKEKQEAFMEEERRQRNEALDGRIAAAEKRIQEENEIENRRAAEEISGTGIPEDGPENGD